MEEIFLISFGWPLFTSLTEVTFIVYNHIQNHKFHFKDAALIQMRESLFLEKQKTIDAMRDDLEQERREIASRSEERYMAKLAEQDAIIKVCGCKLHVHLLRVASYKFMCVLSENVCFIKEWNTNKSVCCQKMYQTQRLIFTLSSTCSVIRFSELCVVTLY